MIELTLDDRVILIRNWKLIPGYTARTNRAPEDCFPGESDTLEDIDARWSDNGQELSDDDWKAYGEEIEEAILKHLEREAA